MNIKRILCCLLSILLLTIGFTSCDKSVKKSNSSKNNKKSTEQITSAAPSADDIKEENNDSEQLENNKQGAEHKKVKVTMQNGGSFVVELYPEYAPETCENFINLVNEGFYNGKTFHRVVDNFMAQGGSSDGLGYEGSSKTIKGEFSANGFTQNTLSHTRGVISMARSPQSFDSASSQFFICLSDQAAYSCDGGYAAFGKVIEGMEVVDGFCKVERTYNGMDTSPAKPVNPIIIASMEVI